MNNGVNPNENNNLNGQVLGANNQGISNTNSANNEIDTLETLDVAADSSVSSVNNGNSSVFENSSVVLNEVNTNLSSNSSIQQTPVNPEPAYTNPQTINPMLGFESPGTIGTTPPISFELEAQPKVKKSNKTLFVIMIVVILIGIGFGTFYVLKYTDLLKSTPKIEIIPKTLEVNMGDRLPVNISDYATITGTDVKNCNYNVEEVDTSKEGTYHFQVTCGEVHEKGIVKVIDDEDLVVETIKVYKVKGESINPNEFIKDINSTYSYEFVDRNEVEKIVNGNAGNYTIKIKATYGEKFLEVDAELIVLQYEIKGYLSCKSNEQNALESTAVMTVEEKFAIAKDGNNGFGGIAIEKYIFKFNDETKYANYLAEYNTKGSITVNDVTGDVEFDNANLTISISNEKSKLEIDSEYGSENMMDYRSIRKYFIETLGYNCSYN